VSSEPPDAPTPAPDAAPVSQARASHAEAASPTSGAPDSSLDLPGPAMDAASLPTGSTASPLDVSPAVAAGAAGDPTMARRGFFRAFTREAIQTVSGVAATAAELQRTSGIAAGQLFGLTGGDVLDPSSGVYDLGLGGLARPLPAPSPLAGAPGEPETTPAGVGFRSPYQLDGTTVVLVDQRHLPDAIVEIRCRWGAEIAAAMRELRVRGAPVLAQVAAYGLWLAAEASRSETGPYMRAAMIRGAADAFRLARPGMAAMRRTIDRVLAAWYDVGEYAEAGDVIADRIKAEADAIAMEALMAQARLGRAGAAALPASGEVALRVLTIDETAALGSGTVGTAMGVISTAAAEGRQLEVLLAETRPTLSGARLGAWELGLAGVPTRVIGDAAGAGLLASGAVDVVLVGADAVAADGALLNAVGTYPLALAAARARIPFLACTTLDALDARATVGAELRPESRRLVAGTLAELDTLPFGSSEEDVVEQPLHDITPPDLISAYVTETGLMLPPFGPALAEAAA
jgi:methylthioribose-1-phosphate isomerase